MPFILFVLKQYIRPVQKIGFTSFVTIISVVSITVGIMVLIIVIAIMTGFESELKAKIMKHKPNLVITKQADNDAMLEYNFIIEKVLAIPGVTQAFTFVTGQGIVSTKKNKLVILIKGLQNYRKFLFSVPTNMIGLKDCNFNKTKPKIILSSEVAETLGVDLGDMVYITSNREIISPVGYIPYIKQFQLVGIIKFNSESFVAYTSTHEAQKLLNLGTSITGIEVKIDNIENTDKISKKILSTIGEQYIDIKSWKENNLSLLHAMKLERVLMFLILSLTILIATFGITASLSMFVLHKKKEIAILKALGAPNKDIVLIFIIKGMFIGSIGTIIGILAGISMSLIIGNYPLFKILNKIYSVNTLPIHLRFYDVALVALFSLIMSFIATIFPTIKAAHVNIVDEINRK